MLGDTCWTSVTTEPRASNTQRHVANGPVERGPHDGAEVGFQLLGSSDDVDRPEQRRRHGPQLRHLPVGSDATAVALERTTTLLDGGHEVVGRSRLVLAVGEQDAGGWRSGARRTSGRPP